MGAFACISDWTENILLLTTLRLYTNQYPQLVNTACVMTIFKYVFL